jgi:hypothetical protein
MNTDQRPDLRHGEETIQALVDSMEYRLMNK